ncbi:MAG: peptide MFS transporter [Acidobacteria bacterium]|nr:peptide MFS transporter [Acidobacteriota bacterium]
MKAASVATGGARPEQDTSFFGHPRGLSTLFFTEFWERWGYYGMRSLLILFMTAAAADGGLGFDIPKASAIYGLYTAMVYMASLPGGWAADRLFGQRRSVMFGGIIIAIGYLALAAPRVDVFYFALVTVIAGTGLLKPNISTIVGQIYAPGDHRRDAGFSIFYMGINMGAFFAPLFCGLVARAYGWRTGMALAGIGMALGVVQYVAGWKHLGDAGLHPVRMSAGDDGRQRRRFWMSVIVLAAAAAAGLLLDRAGVVSISAQSLVNAAGTVLLLVTIGLFGWMFFAARWTGEERKRLMAIAVLFLASTLFWSAFEQAGSSLNLFAARSTDNTIFGWEYPASWLQSVNGFFIWTLAPLFAWIWIRLGSREPSSPAKFAWGLVFLGLGFVVLVGGAALAAGGAKVSPLWLVATYLLHTLGELCLSPVGLSAITKLAPARVAGLMMGVWFLSISIGNYLGGRIASLYEALPLAGLFGAVGAFAIITGLLLALFVRPVTRLMGGVK